MFRRTNYRSMMMSALGVIITLASINPCAYADVSLGDAADSALQPVTGFYGLAIKMCYVLGAGLLCGAVVQYKAHRDSPTHVSLSRSVLLLLFGLAVIAVPFVAKLSAGAAAFGNT